MSDHDDPASMRVCFEAAIDHCVALLRAAAALAHGSEREALLRRAREECESGRGFVEALSRSAYASRGEDTIDRTKRLAAIARLEAMIGELEEPPPR